MRELGTKLEALTPGKLLASPLRGPTFLGLAPCFISGLSLPPLFPRFVGIYHYARAESICLPAQMLAAMYTVVNYIDMTFFCDEPNASGQSH